MTTEIQTKTQYLPLSAAEREQLKTASLAELAKDDNPERYNDPRRIHQQMDKKTDSDRRDWYKELYGELTTITTAQLWQELGMITEFPKQSWEYFRLFKGTSDMYADVQHKNCIHGEDHQGRVAEFAYITGKYIGLSDSELKAAMVAADVHDMARRDDRNAPNHGKDAGDNFTRTQIYINPRPFGFEIHSVRPYIETFQKRGITFTPEEIRHVEILCEYHEKSWEEVPDEYKKEGNRIGPMIQVIQAADAADRFRSPSTRWWPQEKYFMNLFGADMDKVRSFLHFAAYFTLTSEQERFSHVNPHDSKIIEQSIRNKSEEVGILEKD